MPDGAQEREQVEAAPVPEAAPALDSGLGVGPLLGAGAGALGRLAAGGGVPLSPRDVLALQRTAGNQAIQRLIAGHATRASLQRQDPKPPPPQPASPPPIDASMFEVSGGDFSSSGSVVATAQGETVQLDAPAIDSSASVKFTEAASAKEDDPSRPVRRVDAGYIQTIVSSDRVGVYRRWGDPEGEVVAELHQRQPKTVRDAQTRPGTGGTEASFPEPWYSAPRGLTNTPGESVTVAYRDQPGAAFDAYLGQEGWLTETKGEDRFKASVSVKPPDGSPIHLKATDWGVPWEVQLDPIQEGLGGELDITPVKDAARDGPPGAGGLPVPNVRVYAAFDTPEKAMQFTASELLNWLVAAQGADETAHANICEALRRKNPRFSVDITVDDEATVFGGDTLAVTARGWGSATRTVAAAEGAPGTATFSLLELFADPASINAGTTLEVTVAIEGEASTVSVPYPFSASGLKAAAGGGEYTLYVSFG